MAPYAAMNSTNVPSGDEERVFGAPLRYIQGPGAIARIGDVARLGGAHALLVADQFVLELIGERVAESCRTSDVSLQRMPFGGEITFAEIERLARQVGASPVDVVIAAGGGKGIDTGKAIARHLDTAVITVPTIASNDAPTSKIYVVYDESHRIVGVEHMNTNPLAVIVDTELIARAPKKLLLAGIGDAISKKFEVAQCYKAGGHNIYGARGTLAANALADLCYDTLMEHADGALQAVEQAQPNASLEALVEASVLLSGLCFENGGLSVAHAMTRGISSITYTANALHGLQVAYGLLVQLQLENRPPTFTGHLRNFYARHGLPTNLRELGLKRAASAEEIETIAAGTMTAPYIGQFERALQAADLVEAIRAVEALV
jgi:glycerol dehydrogenase